jgi:hypothetical protein
VTSRRLLGAAELLVASLMTAYGLVAFGLGNLYPFSTFSMYSAAHQPNASRIVARDRLGALHEVTAFSAWSCDEPPNASGEVCLGNGAIYAIGYIDRASIAHVLEHAPAARPAPGATATEPVLLVRHVWYLDDLGRTEDCVIAHCRVARR